MMLFRQPADIAFAFIDISSFHYARLLPPLLIIDIALPLSACR
jgi:hypothetical protein